MSRHDNNAFRDLSGRIAMLERRTDRLTAQDAGIPAGTAFPSSPPTNFVYFRTDLGYLCYFDGTRWLTAHEYAAVWTNKTYSATADDFATLVPLSPDHGCFVTRWDTYASTGATNNGTNYWTVRLRDTATNTVQSFNTSGQAINNQTIYSFGSGFTQPSVGQYLNIRTEITAGAPSNLSLFSIARYRLICV